MNAKQVSLALVNCLQSPFRLRPQYCVAANISWGFLPWEADMLVVTKSDHLKEIEIKVSLSDFKKDKDKRKFAIMSRPGRVWLREFWYAVPEKLARKIEDSEVGSGHTFRELVPDERFGICAVGVTETSRYTFRVIRPAVPNREAKKVTEAEKTQLARLASMRYWGILHKLEQLKRRTA